MLEGYVFIASIFAAVCAVFVIYFNGKKHGEAEVKKDQAEDLIDDVKIVKNARDIVKRNRTMSDKLRKKFTR